MEDPKIAKLRAQRESYFAKHDYKNVIRVCKKIMSLSKSEGVTAKAWEDISDAEFGLGNRDKALQALDKAIEVQPDNPSIRLKRSQMAEGQGDNEEAVRHLSSGIKANPNAFESWKYRAELKVKLGDNEGALRDLNSGLESDPQSSHPDSYCNWEYRADFKARLGDHYGAVEDYNKAIMLYCKRDCVKQKKFRVEPSLWERRAHSLQALNQHEIAINSFDYLVKGYPQQSNVWLARGNICSLSGYHREAIQNFENAFAIEPGYYVIWRDKAAAYVRWGHYEEAVVEYKKTISLGPENYDHWKSLGDAYLAWKKFNDAIPCYKKALQMHGDEDKTEAQICLRRAEELSQDPNQGVAPDAELHQIPSMPVAQARGVVPVRRQWCYIQPAQITLGVIIGKGGMGAVYRATWKGQEVAVKKTFQSSFTEVLKNEQAILSRLSHENVVEVYGFTIQAEGEFCLIMNFYSRGSLSGNLYSKKNSLAQRILWAKGVADGLAFLHGNKVLHKDLKTDNVLIADDGRPVIADFGLSDKLKSDQTHQSTFTQQGTITYIAREIMCPEKYQRGKASYSPASDMWAQAVLIWSCATEEPPYKDWQLAMLLNFIVNQDKRLDIPSSAEVKINKEAPGLAKGLAKLIGQCWHTNPAKRPEAKVVSQELEKIYLKLR